MTTVSLLNHQLWCRCQTQTHSGAKCNACGPTLIFIVKKKRKKKLPRRRVNHFHARFAVKLYIDKAILFYNTAIKFLLHTFKYFCKYSRHNWEMKIKNWMALFDLTYPDLNFNSKEVWKWRLQEVGGVSLKPSIRSYLLIKCKVGLTSPTLDSTFCKVFAFSFNAPMFLNTFFSLFTRPQVTPRLPGSEATSSFVILAPHTSSEDQGEWWDNSVIIPGTCVTDREVVSKRNIVSVILREKIVWKFKILCVRACLYV